MIITSKTNLQELFECACQTSEELFSGEQFLVKELFKGYEWNRIPKGLRTKLGSMFLNYATNVKSGSFEVLGKTPQNQQMYKKI